MAGNGNGNGNGLWKGGGLLDCCSDIPVCCKTMCLPCVTFGETREALHGGRVPESGCSPACAYFWCCVGSLGACTFAYSCRTRKDIRLKYGLKPEPCGDCCVHFWCLPCALCQERREVKSRPLTNWPVTEVEESSRYIPPSPAQ